MNKNIKNIRNKLLKITKYGILNKQDYFNYVDDIIKNNLFSYLQEVLNRYYNLDVYKIRDIDKFKNISWEFILKNNKSDFLYKLSALYKNKNVYQIGKYVYSSNYNYTNITIEGPYDNNYNSIVTTSYINTDITNDKIKLNILYNININKIFIYKTGEWVFNDILNTYTPIKKHLLQSIYNITQDNVLTEIPAYMGEVYLLEIHKLNPFEIHNFKLNIVLNNLLGEITEIDDHKYTQKYYYKDIEMSKKLKHFKTYLNVKKYSTNEIQLFDNYDENLNYDDNLLKNYELSIDFLLS